MANESSVVSMNATRGTRYPGQLIRLGRQIIHVTSVSPRRIWAAAIETSTAETEARDRRNTHKSDRSVIEADSIGWLRGVKRQSAPYRRREVSMQFDRGGGIC